MGIFASVLEGIGKLDGVLAALIFNSNAEVLESLSNAALNTEKLVSLALKSMEGAGKAVRFLEKGILGQIYVEYHDSNITLENLPGDRYLAVVGKAGTNLGRIRYEIKKSKKLFEEIRA